MNEISSSQPDASPTVEVIVFQHGQEVARELCQTAEEASVIVDWWSEQEGAECRVEDLSTRHRPDDILESAADDLDADAYPAD